MLKVKTYIAESKIPQAGLGCFAGEFIPKGKLIWEFDPRIDRSYAESDILQMDELTKEFIFKYSFKYRGTYYLCVDNAKFFNHSENPNCKIIESSIDEKGNFNLHLRLITIKDIKAGEEVTAKYTLYNPH